MSGHSKWAQIHRQKSIADAKKGQLFTKLANAITIAAKTGGGDPEANFALRLAIEKAKAANMPKENIERAIKRGTGEIGGATVEEIFYEAYGPAGVGIVIKVQTDNRNRALTNIKTVLNRLGGKLANTGAVMYNFEKVGQIVLKKSEIQIERQMDNIFRSGAKDFSEDQETILVETDPENLEAVKDFLEKEKEEILVANLTLKPINKVTLSPEEESKLKTLVEALLDLEDVVEVIVSA
jgi:YebC/PmpR family DNA-binding regulatory protein